MTPTDNMDSGLAADQPAPSAYNKDKFWLSEDTGELWLSTGSSWVGPFTAASGGGGSDSGELAAIATVTDGVTRSTPGGAGVFDLDGLLVQVEGDNARRLKMDLILPNTIVQAVAIGSISFYQTVIQNSLGVEHSVERVQVENNSNGTPFNRVTTFNGSTIIEPFVGVADLQAGIYAPSYFEWSGYADPAYTEPAILMATWIGAAA